MNSAKIEESIKKGFEARKNKDIETAKTEFQNAIDLGSTKAYCYLGSIYEREKNKDKAFELYQKAVELGEPLGYTYMGDYYDSLSMDYECDGNDEKAQECYKEAASYYEKGYEGKEPKATHKLALNYWYGQGVNRDIDKAKSILNELVESDDKTYKAIAYVTLANEYKKYDDTFIDEEKCLDLLYKAAELSSPSAYETLAKLTSKKGDDALANAYYKKVAQLYRENDMEQWASIAESKIVPCDTEVEPYIKRTLTLENKHDENGAKENKVLVDESKLSCEQLAENYDTISESGKKRIFDEWNNLSDEAVKNVRRVVLANKGLEDRLADYNSLCVYDKIVLLEIIKDYFGYIVKNDSNELRARYAFGIIYYFADCKLKEGANYINTIPPETIKKRLHKINTDTWQFDEKRDKAMKLMNRFDSLTKAEMDEMIDYYEDIEDMLDYYDKKLFLDKQYKVDDDNSRRMESAHILSLRWKAQKIMEEDPKKAEEYLTRAYQQEQIQKTIIESKSDDLKLNEGEFSPIELTFINVRSIFKHCLASKDTKATSKINVDEYTLDRDKMLKNRRTIQYLLGQLKIVHDEGKYKDATDFLYAYDGSIWGESPDDVMKLFYLSAGSELISAANNLYVDGPTFSPKDSHFKSWWLANQKEWELLTYDRVEGWINDYSNIPANEFDILMDHFDALSFDQQQLISDASDRMLAEKLKKFGL